jgi:protein-L-isoaspartate(D-aspartate) O-methyltransferase
MDRHVIDYADARNLMVDGQVRPNKVTDHRIIDAMRRLQRELFVPPAARALAYSDEDVPLPGGRALMEPMVIARLVQIAAPREGERALVVGAGTGYGAALLAACGPAVFALEQDQALIDIARPALAASAPGVKLISGPLAEGWREGAPYDLILVEGAVEEVPEAITSQLRRDSGRLLTVRLVGGRICHAVLAEPVAGAGETAPLSYQPLFDCATPVLPQFRRAPGFVF